MNSQGKVSPYTKEILEKALSKGILVVIASGRALSAIPEDILNIRGLKYIITSNGSSIFELPDSRRIYANRYETRCRNERPCHYAGYTFPL